MNIKHRPLIIRVLYVVTLLGFLSPGRAFSQQPTVVTTITPPVNVVTLKFSPNGSLVAGGIDEGSIFLWDTKSAEQKGVSGFTGGSFCPFDFSPDGKTFVCGYYDANEAKLTAMNLESMQESDFTGKSARVHALKFHPEGKHLAFAQVDKVGVIDVAKPNAPQVLVKQKDTLDLAFSSDGKLLAAANINKTVQVWEGKTKKAKWKLTCKDRVTSVAFSPDGKTFAAASDQIKICDANTGKESTSLKGHGKLVHCVSFSPDGKWLASCGADGMVRIWDVKNQKDVLSFQAHPQQAYGVAFGPNNNLLASSGDDSTLKIWNISQIKTDEK